jgi:nitric oxide reductase activation protein
MSAFRSEAPVYSSLKLQVKHGPEQLHAAHDSDRVTDGVVLRTDHLLPGRQPAVLRLELDKPAAAARQQEQPVGLTDDATLELDRPHAPLPGVQPGRLLQGRLAHALLGRSILP